MLVEVVLKIDGKLKVRWSKQGPSRKALILLFSQKIIALVTKELDGVARAAIKEELTYITDHCLGSGSLDALYA